MAVIDLPAGLWTAPGSGFGQERFDLSAGSDATGAMQTRLYGPPKWALSLVAPNPLPAERARPWQALVIGLRGRVNHLRAWDVAREQPAGTMRGTPTLAASVSAGATSITITAAGQAGKTLLAADKLQIGTGVGTSQLVFVMADVVLDGSGQAVVPIEPPARIGFSAGAAVAWWRPSAYFKRRSASTGWAYESAAVPHLNGLSMDLIEDWTP